MFYLLFFLPISLLILLKLYDKIFGNGIEQKNNKANKIAQKRLKNAKKCIKNNNFDKFFEEIEKSLWGYFADKFKVDIAELSKEKITNYFSAMNIEKKIEQKFIALLNFSTFSSSISSYL